MEIITQMLLNETLQYFLKEWRGETMIALICTIVFAFIYKRQKKIIQEQAERLEKLDKWLDNMEFKLDTFYNQVQQAQTIAEIKNYINKIIKVLSMRDLNNKEATKN